MPEPATPSRRRPSAAAQPGINNTYLIYFFCRGLCPVFLQTQSHSSLAKGLYTGGPKGLLSCFITELLFLAVFEIFITSGRALSYPICLKALNVVFPLNGYRVLKCCNSCLREIYYCTVYIVWFFHKHKSLPLSRYEPSSPISCCAPQTK